MRKVQVRKGRRSDGEKFLSLVEALAKFEKLEPPSSEGKRRLLDDIFDRKRLSLFVATVQGEMVGYALYFFTYSSFVAKPTLYLEDLFVLEKSRGSGVGFALFRKCVDEAVSMGCGRMEWAVLTWNKKAWRFYERLGAKRMQDWELFRLDEERMRTVPRKLL